MTTKIILAFPCMGKTHFANKHPEIALDLESSDYFFDRTGYEHLSSEEFKGIPNRKPKPTGLQDYLTAIDKAVKSGDYQYIFTSQSPDVVKGIIDLGYEVHFVKPLPTDESEKEFKTRALNRGNNNEWIEKTIKFLKPSPLTLYSDNELKSISVHLVPAHYYLEDFLMKDGFI